MKAEIGRKIRQAEGFSAFVPYAFPPKGLLNWPTDLIMKTDRTSHLMGKLDGIIHTLPDVDCFCSTMGTRKK